MRITYKYKRETDTEYAHTDVYLNDVYFGYIIKNEFNEWGFVPETNIIRVTEEHTKAKSKTNLQEQLIKIISE